MINSFFSKKRYFAFLILLMVSGGMCVGYFVMTTIYNVSDNYLQHQRLANVIHAVNKSTIAFKEFLLNSYTDEDFYSTGKNKSTIAFDSNYANAMAQMNLFLDKNTLSQNSTELYSLQSCLSKYRDVFQSATALYRKKGFKDAGLEGDMRKAVHALEKANFLPDLEPLLSLRRHEKDFILRKDLSYLGKYQREWQQLMGSYKSLPALSASQREFLTKALADYQSSFLKIVDIEQQIGLTEDKGLRQEITQSQNLLETRLVEIQNTIEQQTENALHSLKMAIWIVSGSLLFFLIFITALFAIFNDSVRKPVIKLREAATEVSKGRLSVDIANLKKYTLLQELTISIEEIIGKFRDTIAIVDNIAVGKQQQALKVIDSKDEIGRALQSIFERFNDIKIQDEKRAWHNEGLAMFAELAREQHTLKSFSEKAVHNIVKYLGINQAGLFVWSDKAQNIQLTAMYAYDRKKYVDRQLHRHEGLVGQCFAEKESIFITDVPNNYTYITSGLGHATPRCIYLLACQTVERVEAVLELASFQILEEHQRAFLEKIGDTIAATLHLIRINDTEKAIDSTPDLTYQR